MKCFFFTIRSITSSTQSNVDDFFSPRLLFIEFIVFKFSEAYRSSQVGLQRCKYILLNNLIEFLYTHLTVSNVLNNGYTNK